MFSNTTDTILELIEEEGTCRSVTCMTKRLKWIWTSHYIPKSVKTNFLLLIRLSFTVSEGFSSIPSESMSSVMSLCLQGSRALTSTSRTAVSSRIHPKPCFSFLTRVTSESASSTLLEEQKREILTVLSFYNTLNNFLLLKTPHWIKWSFCKIDPSLQLEEFQLKYMMYRCLEYGVRNWSTGERWFYTRFFFFRRDVETCKVCMHMYLVL